MWEDQSLAVLNTLYSAGFLALPFPVSLPFLHFTIRVTAVVDESSLISHAVTVNHHPTIQVQTVVITVIVILLNHSVSKEERND
jgi:hypothetical protein